MDNFSLVVKAEMIRAGLTRQALADALGVSKVTIDRRLQNVRPWTLPEVKKVAKALNTTAHKLVRQTEEAEESSDVSS